MVKDAPGNIWLSNSLGLALPRVGLGSLAVEILDQGLKLVYQKDRYQLKSQFENLRNKAAELPSSTLKRLYEVAPSVLINFQEALLLTVKINDEVDDDLAYSPQIENLSKISTEQDEALHTAAYADIIAAGQVLISPLIQLAYNSDRFAVRTTPFRGMWQLPQLVENTKPNS